MSRDVFCKDTLPFLDAIDSQQSPVERIIQVEELVDDWIDHKISEYGSESNALKQGEKTRSYNNNIIVGLGLDGSAHGTKGIGDNMEGQQEIDLATDFPMAQQPIGPAHRRSSDLAVSDLNTTTSYLPNG